MVADTAPSSGKGVRYGAFGGGGVTALVVEVFLGVCRFDVDRGAEMAISSYGSPTERVSAFIDAHLQPFVKSLPSQSRIPTTSSILFDPYPPPPTGHHHGYC